MKEWETCPKGVALEVQVRNLAERLDEFITMARSHEQRLGEQAMACERLAGQLTGGLAGMNVDELVKAIAAEISGKITVGNGSITWKQLALICMGIAIAASVGPEALGALVGLLK